MRRSWVLDLVQALWRGDLSSLSDWTVDRKIKTIAQLAQVHGMSGWVLERLSLLDPNEAWADRSELRDFEIVRRKQHMQDFRHACSYRAKLHTAGISVGMLKGPELSQILFGDPMLRTSNDFDFLVKPEDFAKAIEIARQADASMDSRLKSADLSGLARLTEWRKDVGFSFGSCLIELHERPFYLASLSDQIEVLEDGKALSLPLPDQLFYSVCHGQMTSWTRLKWALDAGLLGQRLDEADWAAIRDKARLAKCENGFASGLAWLDHLWGTEFSASFGVQKSARFAPQIARLDHGDPRMSPRDALAFTDALSDRWKSFQAYFFNPELTVLESGNPVQRAFRYVVFVVGKLSARGFGYLQSRVLER